MDGSSEDGTIGYIYDAVGNRLQKTVTPDGQSSLTTEYALGYIYENGNLQFFSTPEGYVAAEPNDEFKYVYQYKDHLGNVRLSYTDDPSNLGTAVIIEENNYYPFGLQHKGYNMGGDNALGNDLAQKWKFGGKELDESLNGILSTYDFGARNYDPAIGRWMNIDPLSEKMRRHSPYNYAFDNPIFYIDPDGMEAYASNGYQDLDENEAFVSGAQVLKAGEGSVNITHTDSQGNKSTVSMSSSDFNDAVGGNGGNSVQSAQGNMDCPDCPEPDWNELMWAHFEGKYYVTADGNGNYRYYYPDGSIEDSQNNPGIKTLQAGTDALMFGVPVKVFKYLSGLAIVFKKLPSRSFKSFNALKRALGPAGDGKAWHHIVEQHDYNISQFGQEAIQNTDNVISIPHGAGKLHQKVTGYYNSNIPGTSVRFRDYVKNLPFEEQYKIGIQILEKFGWKQ